MAQNRNEPIDYKKEAADIVPVTGEPYIPLSMSMAVDEDGKDITRGGEVGGWGELGDFLTYNQLDIEKFREKCEDYFKSNKEKMKTQTRNVPSGLTDMLSASFVVGEFHGDISPKAFLIQNMRSLKEAGFETLYLEFLLYDEQASLDNYFETHQMDETLNRRLIIQDAEKEKERAINVGVSKEHWNENNYTALVKAAVEAGIRVVGLEIGAIFLCNRKGENEPGTNRRRDFNYTAARIIELDQARHPSKFFALMGNAHVSRFRSDARRVDEDFERQYGIAPGVGDLVVAARVYICDAKRSSATSSLRAMSVTSSSNAPQKESPAQFKKDSDFAVGEDVLHGDVLIEIKPGQSMALDSLKTTLSSNK